MALELRATVINARDLPLLVRFWQGAVGGEIKGGPVDEARQYVTLWGTSLAIQRSPGEDRPPGRWHLDFYTSSKAEQEAEVARLVALGASVVRESDDPEDDFTVMVDPEGNEFCICLDDG
jgi:predicted enzyme related to lactoylglutathione lyase